MRELLKESGTKHYRHYFYGSTQETLDILREKITEKYPGAVIAGMYSPPFRSLTADEDAEIVEKINAAKPDFVWVGWARRSRSAGWPPMKTACRR